MPISDYLQKRSHANAFSQMLEDAKRRSETQRNDMLSMSPSQQKIMMAQAMAGQPATPVSLEDRQDYLMGVDRDYPTGMQTKDGTFGKYGQRQTLDSGAQVGVRNGKPVINGSNLYSQQDKQRSSFRNQLVHRGVRGKALKEIMSRAGANAPQGINASDWKDYMAGVERDYPKELSPYLDQFGSGQGFAPDNSAIDTAVAEAEAVKQQKKIDRATMRAQSANPRKRRQAQAYLAGLMQKQQPQGDQNSIQAINQRYQQQWAALPPEQKNAQTYKAMQVAAMSEFQEAAKQRSVADERSFASAEAEKDRAGRSALEATRHGNEIAQMNEENRIQMANLQNPLIQAAQGIAPPAAQSSGEPAELLEAFMRDIDGMSDEQALMLANEKGLNAGMVRDYVNQGMSLPGWAIDKAGWAINALVGDRKWDDRQKVIDDRKLRMAKLFGI